MKKAKQLIAWLLIVIMMCSMGTLTAFAAASTGSVILNNAEIDTTYTLYKVFDAEVPDGSVDQASYFATNEALIQLIKNDHGVDIVTSGTNTVCPFDYIGDNPDIRPLPVKHKKPNDPASVAAGRGWLRSTIGTWGPSANKVEKTCSSGNTINFADPDLLPYAYYLLVSDYSEDLVSTVFTLATASQYINNKNVRKPNSAEKVASPSVSGHTGIGGEEIPFEVSFMATNFYTETDTSAPDQIQKYVVTDAFTGLKCTPSEFTVTAVYGAAETTLDYTFLSRNTNSFSIEIPWVEDSGESKYPSPVKVKISYKLQIDNAGIKDTLKAKNNAHIDFTTKTGREIPIEGTDPSVSIYSTGISIRKFKNSTDVTLNGAKFILYKTDGGTNYYYHDGGGSDVCWTTDRTQATEKVADNDYATCEFGGLDEGTYYLRETVAPAGYQLPDDPFTVVVTYNEAYVSTDRLCKFDITIGGVPCEYSGRAYLTAKVSNGTAGTLPQTGGAGTKLLLLCGAILFFATGIVLVAKKRLYNEG